MKYKEMGEAAVAAGAGAAAKLNEIKRCCHTFYLKKRFWDAVCFTHMLVDFK
jgi:hypothetical protein